MSQEPPTLPRVQFRIEAVNCWTWSHLVGNYVNDLPVEDPLWTVDQQSQYIETLLLRLPQHPIVLQRQPFDAGTIWLAGKARRQAVLAFLGKLDLPRPHSQDFDFSGGSLRLRSLVFHPEFNGMGFRDLTLPFRRRILETDLPIWWLEFEPELSVDLRHWLITQLLSNRE